MSTTVPTVWPFPSKYANTRDISIGTSLLLCRDLLGCPKANTQHRDPDVFPLLLCKLPRQSIPSLLKVRQGHEMRVVVTVRSIPQPLSIHEALAFGRNPFKQSLSRALFLHFASHLNLSLDSCGNFSKEEWLISTFPLAFIVLQKMVFK